MLRIQKLQRPNKRSGHNLLPGNTFKMKGITITNVSGGKGVYVDKFTTKVAKKKKSAKKK